MELSFECDNNADASFLAQELESALLRDGIPSQAISLKQRSNENMDIGSVLSLSLEAATQILGPVGAIASFAKCIYEIATKHHETVVIVTSDERVRLPPSKIKLKRVESVVAHSARPKAKSVSKG